MSVVFLIAGQSITEGGVGVSVLRILPIFGSVFRFWCLVHVRFAGFSNLVAGFRFLSIMAVFRIFRSLRFVVQFCQGSYTLQSC